MTGSLVIPCCSVLLQQVGFYPTWPTVSYSFQYDLIHCLMPYAYITLYIPLLKGPQNSCCFCIFQGREGKKYKENPCLVPCDSWKSSLSKVGGWDLSLPACFWKVIALVADGRMGVNSSNDIHCLGDPLQLFSLSVTHLPTYKMRSTTVTSAQGHLKIKCSDL